MGFVFGTQIAVKFRIFGNLLEIYKPQFKLIIGSICRYLRQNLVLLCCMRIKKNHMIEKFKNNYFWVPNDAILKTELFGQYSWDGKKTPNFSKKKWQCSMKLIPITLSVFT